MWRFHVFESFLKLWLYFTTGPLFWDFYPHREVICAAGKRDIGFEFVTMPCLIHSGKVTQGLNLFEYTYYTSLLPFFLLPTARREEPKQEPEPGLPGPGEHLRVDWADGVFDFRHPGPSDGPPRPSRVAQEGTEGPWGVARLEKPIWRCWLGPTCSGLLWHETAGELGRDWSLVSYLWEHPLYTTIFPEIVLGVFIRTASITCESFLVFVQEEDRKAPDERYRTPSRRPRCQIRQAASKSPRCHERNRPNPEHARPLFHGQFLDNCLFLKMFEHGTMDLSYILTIDLSMNFSWQKEEQFFSDSRRDLCLMVRFGLLSVSWLDLDSFL